MGFTGTLPRLLHAAFAGVLVFTFTLTLAHAAEQPRPRRSPFGPDFGKGGTVRVELITNYYPEKNDRMNGRCGGGGGTKPKDPCKFLFDDAIAGRTECAVAATQQKGGTDRLYGCRTNAVPQIQKAIGKAVTICFNDVYGATENYPGVGVNKKPNPVKFDLATKIESQPGKKVNQAGAGDVSCDGRVDDTQNRTRTPQRNPEATTPPPPPPQQTAQNPPPAEEPPPQSPPPPASPAPTPAQQAASSVPDGGGGPSLPSFPLGGSGSAPALPVPVEPRAAAASPPAQKTPVTVVRLGDDAGIGKGDGPAKKDSDISRGEPPPKLTAASFGAEVAPAARPRDASGSSAPGAARAPASATASGGTGTGGGGGGSGSFGDAGSPPPRSNASSPAASSAAAGSSGPGGGMPSASLGAPPSALPQFLRSSDLPTAERSAPVGEAGVAAAGDAPAGLDSQGGIGGTNSPSLFERVHAVHARYQEKEYLR